MNQPQPTPWMLARLRDAAEQILLEAKEIARQRDQLRDENALAIARDRDDAREEEQAVRALQEIQRGHEFTPENTIRRRGKRECRTCANAAQRRRHATRRAA